VTSAQTPQLRRPMDVGQIIDGAIRLYRLNFGEFLAMAAVALPFVALVFVVDAAISPHVATTAAPLLFIPLFGVLVVTQAAMARAVADVADGNRPEFNSVYARVFQRLRTLLASGYRLLVGVMVLFITVIGIPFGIYLAVRWVFFSQVIMTESESTLQAIDLQHLPISGPNWKRTGPLAAYERGFSSQASAISARLVEGVWWRTFGGLLIVNVVAGIPALAVQLAFFAASPIGAALASAVVAVIVFPFTATAYTLLFFDLQSRERERVSIA